MLEYDGHAPPQRELTASRARRRTHIAGAGAFEKRQLRSKRRLAGAVRADDRERLAARDVKLGHVEYDASGALDDDPTG